MTRADVPTITRIVRVGARHMMDTPPPAGSLERCDTALTPQVSKIGLAWIWLGRADMARSAAGNAIHFIPVEAIPLAM